MQLVDTAQGKNSSSHLGEAFGEPHGKENEVFIYSEICWDRWQIIVSPLSPISGHST